MDDKIFSFGFHQQFLIVGSSGKLHGHTISPQTGAILKKAWTIQLPISQDLNEVNSLWVDHENEIVYAGCGDGALHVCSLDDGRVVKSYKDHTDYIHSVDGCEKLVATASEDGYVKFWDSRENSPVFALEPAKNPKIQRKNFGDWIGAVCMSKEWVATGGGPSLALYHLRNREPFQIFDFPKEIHVSTFIDDYVVVGGEASAIHQYSFNGELVSEMPTSGPSIMSIVWQKQADLNILSACGASNKIDISTNFKYKDSQLTFYGK